jgi:hypothetical protein
VYKWSVFAKHTFALAIAAVTFFAAGGKSLSEKRGPWLGVGFLEGKEGATPKEMI